MQGRLAKRTVGSLRGALPDAYGNMPRAQMYADIYGHVMHMIHLILFKRIKPRCLDLFPSRSVQICLHPNGADSHRLCRSPPLSAHMYMYMHVLL